MGKKKIGQFTNKPTPGSTDMFLIQDGSTGGYYNVTKAQLSALMGTVPTEETFSSDGSTPITLSTTPSFVMVFNGSIRMRNGVDYTIAADEITFLYEFETTDIDVIKF